MRLQKDTQSVPHVHAGALRLYEQALLAEKLYSANIFENKAVNDIPLCESAKDLRNNPQTAWEKTFAIYPYTKQAVEEVEKEINIPGHYLGYWQIIDGISWAIEYEIEGWRSIIYDYEVKFLGRESEK
jgi:hypothetical protein